MKCRKRFELVIIEVVEKNQNNIVKRILSNKS